MRVILRTALAAVSAAVLADAATLGGALEGVLATAFMPVLAAALAIRAASSAARAIAAASKLSAVLTISAARLAISRSVFCAFRLHLVNSSVSAFADRPVQNWETPPALVLTADPTLP